MLAARAHRPPKRWHHATLFVLPCRHREPICLPATCRSPAPQDQGDTLDATFHVADSAMCSHPTATPVAPAANSTDGSVVLQAMAYPGYYIGYDSTNMAVLMPVRRPCSHAPVHA